MTHRSLRKCLSAVAAAVLCAGLTAAPAAAQTQKTIKGERYVPSIWVDPDGCEHWVMDDGAEGYMSAHLTRDGKPVCRQGKLCGIMETDQYFPTDQWSINATGQQRLRDFFAKNRAAGFVITGHTDSRASDAYNMTLSQRRANSVAQVARQSGVRVVDVRGYGERQPRASNDTSAGMARNRRVEIMCLN